MNKICSHCEPIEAHPFHFIEKMEIYMTRVCRVCNVFRKPFGDILSNSGNLDARIEKLFVYTIINILANLKILKIIPIKDLKDKSGIYNRTLVVAREAEEFGYIVSALKIGKSYLNIFKINLPNKSLFFCALPLVDFGRIETINFEDKHQFKLFLKSNNFPYCQGEVFNNFNPALQYGAKIGFPLVVKPRFGSLSRHTTINIKNEEELKRAIEIVKIISDEFIVEKYIEGKDYRVTIVGNKMIACALREPPNVVGNGNESIEQLIKRKNSDILRGEKNQKNTTLHKIGINRRTAEFLNKQNYHFDYVPKKNEKIYLDNKVILASGADIHDATDKIHKENIVLLEELSKLLGTSLIGFDIITSDISKPHNKIPFSIIEANGAPYIDMHHFPTYGKKRNVARAILCELKSKYNC